MSVILREFLQRIIGGRWFIEIPFWARAVMYSAIFFGVGYGLVALRASEQNEGAEGIRRALPALLIISVATASAAAWIQDLIFRGAAALFLGSSSGPARPPIDIAKIKGHLRHERWDEARTLLQDQWSAYPGDGELLREWERLLYDGMKAPAGMVDFFEKALPDLKGEDRAYAYLRLAELCADHLNRKPDARKWVQRLVVQHPGSPMAAQAKLMLAELPKE